MPSRSIDLVVVSLLLSLMAGCETKVVKSLGELAVVHAEIVKKFGEEGVNVNQNDFGDNTTIAVTFINSSLNDKSLEEREKRAQETATIVKNHYKSISDIDAIFVTFVRQTTRFAFFHYNEGLGTFGFDRDARALDWKKNSTERKYAEGHYTESENPLQATANYSATQHQTEISLGGIQLEGVAGAGLTLIPHFKLAGDANKRPSQAPETVTFDFASYGTKPKFPGLTKVRIIADGKLVFEKEGQFSTSRTANDQVTEFLYLPLPYLKFRQLVAGEEVTIVLGDHRYKLEHLQLIALRNMTAYVRN